MTAARVRADGLRARSSTASSRSAVLRADNRDLRTAYRDLRARADHLRTLGPLLPVAAGGFRVTGWVDEQPVSACWHNGRLHADQALLDRADIVVQLGDRWRRPGTRNALRATLRGNSITVVLTLMRAMTSVTSVEIHDGQSTVMDVRTG